MDFSKIVNNPIDRSGRCKPDEELGMFWYDGYIYKETKVYKGFYCIGTKWSCKECLK